MSDCFCITRSYHKTLERLDLRSIYRLGHCLQPVCLMIRKTFLFWILVVKWGFLEPLADWLRRWLYHKALIPECASAVLPKLSAGYELSAEFSIILDAQPSGDLRRKFWYWGHMGHHLLAHSLSPTDPPSPVSWQSMGSLGWSFPAYINCDLSPQWPRSSDYNTHEK